MGASTQNNSTELPQEQSVETPVGQAGEQPGGGESSGEGINISLDDINRDDLSPENQVVYDNLLERGSSMQADYTRKTTELAGYRRDAEYWRTIQGHKELSGYVNKAVNDVYQGVPLGTSLTGQAPLKEEPKPNPDEDPEGYMRLMIRDELKGVLGDVLPDLQRGIQSVTGQMASNQSRIEFDNIAARYPAAKAIGIDEIQRVQQAYQNNGRPISMEEALALMALDTPNILEAGTATTRTSKGTPVERPSSGAASGGDREIVVPEGVKALIKQARQLDSDGDTSLAGAARRALTKIRNATAR